MQQQAFYQAIASGDKEQLTALIASNHSLLAATMPSGVSGVMWAVYTQHTDIAHFLIDQGAAVTLYEAAALGLTDSLEERLAAAPEQVDSFSIDGFTALGLAAFFGNEAAVDILLAHGAQPNRSSQNAQQVTPLHSAVAHQHVKIAQTLITHGANVDALQERDFTPLQEAAHTGNIALVRLLLDAGASVNLRNQLGNTALAYADENNNSAIQELLKQHGATL